MAKTKEELLKQLEQEQLLPLYTATDLDILPVVEEVLTSNGLNFIEVTYRSDLASAAIKQLSQSGKLIVGAGTVRDLATAKDAIENGATFIVTPGFSPEVVDYCNENDVLVVPGTVTPSEIIQAMDKGISTVKFFPADVYGGLKAIKALSGPFFDIKFVPTGGVNLDNCKEFLSNDAIAAVGGSFIISEKLVQEDNGVSADKNIKEILEKLNNNEVKGMKWTFRWYGSDDPVTLDNIRQIPNMYGVVGTLTHKLPGDVWEIHEIEALKKEVEAKGLTLAGIESVSVHDSIKAGTADRDKYIENYKQTIRNLGACDVKVICYSFKPIFGWAKTNLNYELADGSHTLEYDDAVVQQIEPKQMYGLIKGQTSGFELSGWEPERLEKFHELEAMYEGLTEEGLFQNFKYFLEAIIPVCEEADVKMAVHPDDPPFNMFEYPRITKNKEDILRIVNAVDSPYNGVTFCTGSYGANPENDLVDMIHALKGKINFVHFRNVKILGHRHFLESAHLSSEGSLDMYAIMEALVETGFDGLVRPDHGRAIWDEVARPGYGLYDRALGLSYLQGLEEAAVKNSKK